MQIKTRREHFILIKVAILKKMDNNKSGGVCREIGNLYTVGGNAK